MEIQIVQGIEEINKYATLAMYATLDALVADGAVARSAADEFADSHVLALMSGTGMWARIRKLFGLTGDTAQFMALRVAVAPPKQANTGINRSREAASG